MNDLENELNRIRCMINYYILNESIRYSSGFSRNDDFTDMNLLTHKSGSFTKKDYQRFEEIIGKVKNGLFLSGSNLLREVSLSITNVSNMDSNRWFTCSNDHVYQIDQVRDRQILI